MEINPNFSKNALNDYLLVESVKKGDQKAFEQLMTRYKNSVFYMVLKMLDNREDANDATQLTFCKAFENLEKYKPDFAFSTWLFKIATNNAIDMLRKRKSNTVSINNFNTENDKIFNLKCEVLNPEEQTIKKQQIESLKSMINTLPPRYYDLVRLRYFQEKSYEEIALELNLPMGTVKARLFRARDFLSVILKKKQKNLNSDF